MAVTLDSGREGDDVLDLGKFKLPSIFCLNGIEIEKSKAN